MTATDARMESEVPSPIVGEGPGARLKHAREAAGLSLDQVAQQLKLAPRQVKALEEEDFAQLPGRTFARGFVRNYARLLNLNGDELLALLPDSARAPALEAPALHSTGSMIAELPTAAGSSHNFARWMIPLLLVACIVGAAAYEWYRAGLSSQGDVARVAVPQPPPLAPTAPTASTELPNPLAAGTGGAAGAPPPTEASSESGAAQIATAAPETVAPTAAPLPPAPLQLSYHGPSWTEVRDRDGQVLIARLVAAGSEQAIRGTPPFDIVIGNARAVTVVFRGNPVDLTRYTRQNVARLRLR